MLHLRRPDVCIVCGVSLAAGCRASWDPTARTVTCAKCAQASGEGPGPGPPEHALDQGRPGASAAREHRKRKRKREARTRQAHPRVGGLLLALRREPRQEAAFRLGELGEKTTANYLERRTLNAPVMLLHDRRMPEVRGNIDHLAITPTGVFVIDAKNVKGKVRITQPLLGAAKLLIAGRNSHQLPRWPRSAGAVRAPSARRCRPRRCARARRALLHTARRLPARGRPAHPWIPPAPSLGARQEAEEERAAVRLGDRTARSGARARASAGLSGRSSLRHRRQRNHGTRLMMRRRHAAWRGPSPALSATTSPTTKLPPSSSRRASIRPLSSGEMSAPSAASRDEGGAGRTARGGDGSAS
jgi:hypothetical protein